MFNYNITIYILLIRVTVGGICHYYYYGRGYNGHLIFRTRNVYFMYNMYSALKISSSSAAADIII